MICRSKIPHIHYKLMNFSAITHILLYFFSRSNSTKSKGQYHANFCWGQISQESSLKNTLYHNWIFIWFKPITDPCPSKISYFFSLEDLLKGPFLLETYITDIRELGRIENVRIWNALSSVELREASKHMH